MLRKYPIYQLVRVPFSLLKARCASPSDVPLSLTTAAHKEIKEFIYMKRIRVCKRCSITIVGSVRELSSFCVPRVCLIKHDHSDPFNIPIMLITLTSFLKTVFFWKKDTGEALAFSNHLVYIKKSCLLSFFPLSLDLKNSKHSWGNMGGGILEPLWQTQRVWWVCCYLVF